MATCVIVDGNNLAHYLYKLGSARSIPLEIDAQLVDALSAWARGQDREFEVELCLDPRREKAAGNEMVKVFAADPGRQADGMIVGKVSHRVYAQDTCLVITSDEELRARVAEFQVRCVTVRDFVISAFSTPPTFMPLPARIPKGQMPSTSDELSGRIKPVEQNPKPAQRNESPGRKKFRAADLPEEYNRLIAKTLAARSMSERDVDPHSEIEPASKQPETASMDEKHEIQMVHLTLTTWPLQAGAKFLRESFCSDHFPAVSELFIEGLSLNPTDLPVLAEFLLDHCAQEADFVRRGGCLMDRVRLALLRAAGMQLTFPAIAGVTGDSIADVKRKVRQNIGRWVAIETISAQNIQKEA